MAELADPGTTVHWLLRAPNPSRAYGGGDADALPARGAIGTRVKALADRGAVTVHTGFFVHEITDDGIVSADGRKVDADVIVNATGARPDHNPATELRLDLDPILGSTRALAPLIDPNEHSCGTVPPHGVDELTQPEAGFYRRRRQVLRPRPHLPARDRLRADPLGRGGLRRRLGGGPRRAAGPARNRRLLDQPRRRWRPDGRGELLWPGPG